MARLARTFKLFGGKRFKRRFMSLSKSEASRLARDLRKEGHLARVTKVPRVTPMWQVWQGPRK